METKNKYGTIYGRITKAHELSFPDYEPGSGDDFFCNYTTNTMSSFRKCAIHLETCLTSPTFKILIYLQDIRKIMYNHNK